MLRFRQSEFISLLAEFDNWVDRFNFLIEQSDRLPVNCPPELQKHRIEFCRSNTCFRAWIENDELRVDGWSNAPVQRGIITSIIDIFDHLPVCEFKDFDPDADIYFHEQSGLIDNLTPLRADGLREMIRRILTVISQ